MIRRPGTAPSAHRILDFDPGTGIVVAQAGVSLAQVIARTHPHGWLPPVIGGHRRITLGEAVAGDVFGGNHLSSGSFGAHVRWIELAPGRPGGPGEPEEPDEPGSGPGSARRSPTERPDEFWATVGGLGLTGALAVVALQLRRASPAELYDRQPARALSEVLWLMDAATRDLDPDIHAVARVDGAVSGRSLGRGVIETYRLIGREGVCGPISATARVGALPVATTFGSEDRTWLHRRRLPEGVEQYQLAVPPGGESVLLRTLSLLRDAGRPPVRATVRRLGPGNSSPLSFASPGWAMAMEFGVGRRGGATPGPSVLPSALERVSGMVADAGGRVHLAGRARLSPALLSVMYPRLAQWRAIRAQMNAAR